MGGHTERSLWQQGCESWTQFLESPKDFSLGGASKQEGIRTIERSVAALDAGEHQFFQEALGGRESWRAWPAFRESCVYLDIETDGGMSGESITTIGLYDGKEFRCLVKGEDIEDFRDIITNYSMIVTFFGAGFDVPMLKRRFPDVKFDHIHLDLCFALKRLGYKGGLKRIERQLGIARGDDTDGLTGLDAIRLWREHLRGSPTALTTLVEYNREDVVNLERLAEIAYPRMEALTLSGAEPSPSSSRFSRSRYRVR